MMLFSMIQQWENNFETISKFCEIKFIRAIVPDDAINLDMEIIEISDASQNIACSATNAKTAYNSAYL